MKQGSKTLIGLAAALSLCISTAVSARCMEGETKACTLGGKHGLKECISGAWKMCQVDTSGPTDPPVEGSAKIAYKIVSVVYAPPGSAQNFVFYGQESSMGSTGSSEGTFNQGYGVEVSTSGKIAGWDAGASAGFTYGQATQWVGSYEIKKVQTWSYKYPGPPPVGVNHDDDMIILLLGPQIQVKLFGGHAVWRFDQAAIGELIGVYVGELKNPSTMTAGTRSAFDRAGVTAADFATILKVNPFANGAVAVDTNRFKYTGSIIYRGPRSAGGEPITTSGTLSQSLENSSSSSATNSYEVKVTAETGGGFGDVWKVKLKVNGQWTWTDTAKISSTTGQTDKAELSVVGPPYGYMGPETIDVYYDALYRTFMFQPSTAPMTFAGKLQSRSGARVGSTKVVLLTSGATYQTFSDQDGNFVFNRPVRGVTQLRAAGVRRTLTAAEIGSRRANSLMIP